MSILEKCNNKNPLSAKCLRHYTLVILIFAAIIILAINRSMLHAAPNMVEPVQACIILHNTPLNKSMRAGIAQCLGWQDNANYPLCKGHYLPLTIIPTSDDEVNIQADSASLYETGRSQLIGNVEVRDSFRVVSAETANIYRDDKTHQIVKIELLNNVRYKEQDRLMIARRAVINPTDKSGRVEDVLYRFKTERASALLPAWGRASVIERLANQDYRLKHATYSTCAPKDRAWQIEAKDIQLDYSKSKGVAKNAILRLHDWPLLYTPYLSFPTSKARKSGFLMPLVGYSNVGGYDLAVPYYWNLAPNYDATITPHLYTRRGLMMGGAFRYLTERHSGKIQGDFLPNDKAFAQFLQSNRDEFPSLRGLSNNRWSFLVHEQSVLFPNAHLGINYQQVSDDYYLQDFSTNLATTTTNQLLRQGDLSYRTRHWLFQGMLQSYQTLHPINQSIISGIYERLPQLLAEGSYSELPLNLDFNVRGQFDNFRWPDKSQPQPQGPRTHVNPVLSFTQFKPWGHFSPSVQVVNNYYDVQYHNGIKSQSFNKTIPRYSVDGGLVFERTTKFINKRVKQTLEPRLYYLNVPFQNQIPIPVYDSAYMIFTYDQLFRTNRFSGFDRIGDANQLAYALTSRWFSDETGFEKASVSIGQLRYFSKRRVTLCYDRDGQCTDSPLMLGYLSPNSDYSPIASRLQFNINPIWSITGDYVWDVYTNATNNGYVNLHYQAAGNKMMTLGYSYLVNGDLTQVANNERQNNALNQATFSYAWPLSEHWSSLGVYNYNISKKYSMMTFFGLQYDDCCWAFRIMGGRTFKSLSATSLSPQYNNNVFLQIILKGLGSAATGDPSRIIGNYFRGYDDIFRTLR